MSILSSRSGLGPEGLRFQHPEDAGAGAGIPLQQGLEKTLWGRLPYRAFSRALQFSDVGLPLTNPTVHKITGQPRIRREWDKKRRSSKGDWQWQCIRQGKEQKKVREQREPPLRQARDTGQGAGPRWQHRGGAQLPAPPHWRAQQGSRLPGFCFNHENTLITSSDEWPVVDGFDKVQKGPEMKNKFYREDITRPLNLRKKRTFKVE